MALVLFPAHGIAHAERCDRRATSDMIIGFSSLRLMDERADWGEHRRLVLGGQRVVLCEMKLSGGIF